MEIFKLTLSQMLMLFSFISIGYILRKTRVVSENAYVGIARLATYVFTPALTFNNLLNNCTVENFAESSKLMLYGLVTILAAMLISYPLSALFVKKPQDEAQKYKRNIYKYAATFGNYGYLGNFLILGVYGSEMLYKFIMFTLPLSVVCNSWGLSVLVPGGNKRGIREIIRDFMKPPVIALFLGIICGLLNLKEYLPDFVLSTLSNASACMGPSGMLLAGIVIGEYRLGDLIRNKKVYIITLLRLVIIPALFATVLILTGVRNEIILLTLMAFAVPLGLNTIVFPAAFGGDTKTGAAMTMISHTLAIITIPVMYYIFIVATGIG